MENSSRMDQVREDDWEELLLRVKRLRIHELPPEAYLKILVSLGKCLECAQMEMAERLRAHQQATESFVDTLHQLGEIVDKELQGTLSNVSHVETSTEPSPVETPEKWE